MSAHPADMVSHRFIAPLSQGGSPDDLPPVARFTMVHTHGQHTGNWLLLRYIHKYLCEPRTRVVVLSFIRPYSYWYDAALSLGLDLMEPSKRARFGFVDAVDLSCDWEWSPSYPWEMFQVLERTTKGLIKETLDVAEQEARDLRHAAAQLGGNPDDADARAKVVVIVDHVDILEETMARPEASLFILGLLLDIYSVSVFPCCHFLLPLPLRRPLTRVFDAECQRNHRVRRRRLGAVSTAGSDTLTRASAMFGLFVAYIAGFVIATNQLGFAPAPDSSGVVRLKRGGGAADESLAALREKEYNRGPGRTIARSS